MPDSNVVMKKPVKPLSKERKKVVKAGKWYESQRNQVLMLIFIPVLVYIQVLSLGFTMLDDTIFIVENQLYNKDLANIVQSFQRGLFNPEQDIYYRPVFLVDFILESRLFGINAAGYHFSNLVFHVLCVVLLFFFLKAVRIKQTDAFILSLFFALHPVLVQAVAWIPGRNDMLLMIFFLASVLLALKYVRKPDWYLLLLQGITMLIALFTKETAVIIPVIILAVIIFIEKSPWKRWIPLIAVWIIAVILWSLTRSQATLLKRNFTVWELIQNGLERTPALLQYLGKIFFPFNLSVFPGINHITIWWGVLALALVIGLIVWSKSYFKVLTLVGLGWFILFLLPVLVVPPSLNDQVFEHRLYIPIVGILLILSQTRLFGDRSDKGNNLPVNRQSPAHNSAFINNFKPILAGFVLLAYTIITLTRIGHFKDPVTFWGHAVEDNPSSSYASMMYGLRQEEKPEMKIHLMNAYRLNPDEKMLNYLIGRLELEAGNYKEAEFHLKRETKISQIPDNYFNLAMVYFKKNNLDSAAWCLEHVITLDPLHPQANNNLSLLYMQLNRKQEARKLFESMQQRGVDIPAQFREFVESK